MDGENEGGGGGGGVSCGDRGWFSYRGVPNLARLLSSRERSERGGEREREKKLLERAIDKTRKHIVINIDRIERVNKRANNKQGGGSSKKKKKRRTSLGRESAS